MDSRIAVILFHFLPFPLFQLAAFLKLQARGFETLESLTLVVPLALVVVQFLWSNERTDTSDYSEEEMKEFLSKELSREAIFPLVAAQCFTLDHHNLLITPYHYILLSFLAVNFAINGWTMEDPRCQYNYFKNKKTFVATVFCAVTVTCILSLSIFSYIYEAKIPLVIIPSMLCLAQCPFRHLRTFVIYQNGFSLKQVAEMNEQLIIV